MKRKMRILMLALAACAFVALPAHVMAQAASVQIISGDARVFLAADASSAVVTPVPVGAILEVVTRTGEWFQVRLPRDSSGFDRLGYVQRANV